MIRYYQPPPPQPEEIMTREKQNTGFAPFLEELQKDDRPVTRADFNALLEEFYKLERTVYGIQQMLGKAAEYKGKPRGRLPR